MPGIRKTCTTTDSCSIASGQSLIRSRHRRDLSSDGGTFQTESPGGLEIDREIELGRLASTGRLAGLLAL